MKNYIISFFLFFLSAVSLTVYAQTKKQFSGSLLILEVSGSGDNRYLFRGLFSDPSNTFTANNVKASDHIIDVGGNTFLIESVTTSGSEVIATTISLNKNAGQLGDGIVYRPTPKGLPLTVSGVASNLMSSVINSGSITIDEKTSSMMSGNSIPTSSFSIGDVLLNTNDLGLYRLTNGGWTQISSSEISTSFEPDAASIPPGKKGDVVVLFWDNKKYTFNGASWVLPDEVSGLPFSAKFGDVFYVTTQKKLYMMDDEGNWVVIGDGGAGDEIPDPNKPGDLFFNIDEQILYVYDNSGNWVEVILVDETATDISTGDVLPTDPKAGDIFYNTTEKTLYIFDGVEWIPIGNDIPDLPKDMFYIGDENNKATPIEKGDVPLSGFGGAQDSLLMNNHRITQLGDPIYPEDAATKGYVDNKTANAGDMFPSSPKAGDIFFNTDDNRLYFYSGTDWVSLDNTLLQDHFYIGDSKNKAVGIEKSQIPISGFGIATADISLGNGSNNYKIVNLGSPTEEFDAVPKGYVDNILEGVTDGYMERAIYDSNQDSIVDVAATVNGHTVESNVPDSAVFTDELVKVGPDGTPLYLSENDFEVDVANSEIILKKLDFSKFDLIADNTLLGNNLGGDASPIPLTPEEVKVLLKLDRVDNSADNEKHVYSASRIDPPIMINGQEFDGSGDINFGDNLGNHTATENIKLGGYSIGNDGQDGKGLTFSSEGNGAFAQDLTVKGNFYTPSDQRLKTNVETLTEALESLDQLRGVRFEYIDQKKYMIGPKVGLIAQELQKVYPEMVNRGSDGFLKVDYTQLSAVLIQAVKEQQQQLKAQAQEIEELKKRMYKQEGQLDSIIQKLIKHNE